MREALLYLVIFDPTRRKTHFLPMTFKLSELGSYGFYTQESLAVLEWLYLKLLQMVKNGLLF